MINLTANPSSTARAKIANCWQFAGFGHPNALFQTVWYQPEICRVRFSFPANRNIHLRQK